MNTFINYIWIQTVVCIILEPVSAGEWIPWNDSEYYFEDYNGRLSWEDAKAKCSQLDATLAVVSSSSENTFLTTHMNGYSHWIGLHQGDSDCSCFYTSEGECQACRESWKWVDESAMEFQNWEWGHPYSGRTCCRIFSDGTWFSTQYCDYLRRFICERPLCDALYCGNGECVARYGKAACVCDPGFSGETCQLEIDECVSSPCLNNGTCMDSVNSYMCLCEEYYNGTYCEIYYYVPPEDDDVTEKQSSFADNLNKTDSDSTGFGMTVGIAVLGALLLIVSIAVIVLVIRTRRKQNAHTDNDTDPGYEIPTVSTSVSNGDATYQELSPNSSL